MSVLIKGMKMPEGEVMTINIWADGRVYILGKNPMMLYDAAVELPDHGDLIDRDELLKRAVFMPRGGVNLPLMYMSYVKAAKAIIPAERSAKVCPLHSDDEVTEYCVEGPCMDETEDRCPIAERSEE